MVFDEIEEAVRDYHEDNDEGYDVELTPYIALAPTITIVPEEMDDFVQPTRLEVFNKVVQTLLPNATGEELAILIDSLLEQKLNISKDLPLTEPL